MTIVPLRIVLIAPPAGVDFGIQEGKGSDYKAIHKQRSRGGDLHFEFNITLKDTPTGNGPNFVGPISQGPPDGRFIYVDIGTLAGQGDCCWERRIKVPLVGITQKMVEKTLARSDRILEARLPGTGKDGGPSCATVKPIGGWAVVDR